MRLLLEEERATLDQLNTKLKDYIDTVKKFQTEPEYPKQFLWNLTDFKDDKVYSFTNSRTARQDFQTDISSTETENSDIERDRAPQPPRTFNRPRTNKGSRSGNTKSRAQNNSFLG